MNKFRILGVHKLTGKITYLSYASHKGEIFYSKSSEPTKFKTVDHKDFITLQLIAQKELDNVRWECDNETTERRNQISNRFNSRVASKTTK